MELLCFYIVAYMNASSESSDETAHLPLVLLNRCTCMFSPRFVMLTGLRCWFAGSKSYKSLRCSYTLSAGNFCKQFGTRTGVTECRACSGSKQFATLVVFLK